MGTDRWRPDHRHTKRMNGQHTVMKRQTQFFMTESDQDEFSASLLQRSPRIRFIDDNIWPQPLPKVARSVSECQSRYVFIWDPIVVAELPTIRRPDGSYQGPQ